MRQTQIKDEVLREICRGETVSGGMLASKFGVSRAAVWKAVEALRAEGYFISGLGGGYLLAPQNTRLCGEQMSALLGENIIFKDETISTNEDLKQIAEAGGEEFTTVVARRQTGGKGRLGRRFESPEGGLYFSVLLRPDIPAQASLKITTAAAAAMAAAIDKVASKEAKIKWVNDIYISDKKVCGILTEGVFDAENNSRLKYCVLGVGVNVGAPKGGFPAEIKDKAGTLFEAAKVPSLVFCALLGEFLARFKEYYAEIEKMPHIGEYRRRSYLDGREITYERDGKTRTATVYGTGDGAELLVKEKRKIIPLTSGEVEISVNPAKAGGKAAKARERRKKAR